MSVKYQWEDKPNRKEKRRRYASMRRSYRDKRTTGAFGTPSGKLKFFNNKPPRYRKKEE